MATCLQDLERVGLRPTFSRMSVLALFSEGMPHLSAEEVYQNLQERGFRVGLASIYRVLTQFEHAGLLYRHRYEDGRATYELSSDRHHDHMICVDCKKMIEFNDPIIEERKRKIAEEAGFVLDDHVLYLYVSCLNPACPGKQNR
ncbi:MAG: transcriptional repressor [Magnetococcales bacterium]|nr:transcriptional repressor [Magnetococcales bacterium]